MEVGRIVKIKNTAVEITFDIVRLSFTPKNA